MHCKVLLRTRRQKAELRWDSVACLGRVLIKVFFKGLFRPFLKGFLYFFKAFLKDFLYL